MRRFKPFREPSLLNQRMTATQWRAESAQSEQSKLEDLLASQLDDVGIDYERQAKAIPGRRFSFDFLVPPDLLIEVEGGIWNGGRHVRGGGFTSGCEKQALAVIAGFREIRVTADQVKDGEALAWIEKALDSGKDAA